MDKLADEYGDSINFICINTRGLADAKQYTAQKGLKSAKLLHGATRPPDSYGLRYIPHKVVISSDGIVRKNFDGVNATSDAKALAAGEVPSAGGAGTRKGGGCVLQ
mmetsp:Transcript_11155/g.22652  ORF Transcript_11155/g.22652 Transcript_11155/m.22652 type:complete len:106 (+) Transcript_11155:240-557(+)